MKIESRLFSSLGPCFFNCKMRSITPALLSSRDCFRIIFSIPGNLCRLPISQALCWLLRTHIWVRFGLCHPGAQSLAPDKAWKYIISLHNNVAIRISREHTGRNNFSWTSGSFPRKCNSFFFFYLELIQSKCLLKPTMCQTLGMEIQWYKNIYVLSWWALEKFYEP